MSKKQKLLVGCLILFVVAIVSTSCLQNVITPAYIDPVVIEYSGEEPKIFAPWTTIWDLERIERSVDYNHLTQQKMFARLAENDVDKYHFLKDSMSISMVSAQELKSAVFSPEGGLLSLLIAGSGIGIGGLLIPRGKDTKKIKELETKLNGSK